ncbi:MAG: anthranilate phosphoribosyltransferase [Acidobacteriota bacterium]|nr:anthranilate phosphoribosyltransferase [Acidobacteriota bacterium]
MNSASTAAPAAPAFSELLRPLVAARSLTREQAAHLVDAMLAPETPDTQIAAALALLVAKGESPEELAGFADSLYRRVLPTEIPSDVLDTAGTGASAVKTFNVSSAASFVIAAAGCRIAKHGARASTSRSGSADVLTALGVRIDCDPAVAERCLRELGICFLFAPKYHPALARVAPIRRSLGIRTTFNLVGPMVSPCRAQYRLLGVADEKRMEGVAGALSLIGVKRGWVLRGGDGLDELTTAGPSRVVEIGEGGHIEHRTLTPEDFGLASEPTAPARASTIEENAATVRAVLGGERRDVARSLVILNASAALHVRTGDSLRDCASRASRVLDDGSALRKLDALVALSNSPAGVAQ